MAAGAASACREVQAEGPAAGGGAARCGGRAKAAAEAGAAPWRAAGRGSALAALEDWRQLSGGRGQPSSGRDSRSWIDSMGDSRSGRRACCPRQQEGQNRRSGLGSEAGPTNFLPRREAGPSGRSRRLPARRKQRRPRHALCMLRCAAPAGASRCTPRCRSSSPAPMTCSSSCGTGTRCAQQCVPHHGQGICPELQPARPGQGIC